MTPVQKARYWIAMGLLAFIVLMIVLGAVL